MSLEVDGVSAGYGGTQVIWDVSLTCKESTISVIVGPNGAGKSTTLKTVNGLLKPWNGHIYLGKDDITDLPAYRRVECGIASCPEGRRLFPRLSTESNLRLGAYSRRARDSAEANLERVYRLFPRLRERVGLNVAKLSGGEQQMVSIGRALMASPKIVVLDEPSLGIAPKLTAEIFEKLVELRKEGLSMLIVEQNAVQALRVADYAYVLQEGRVKNRGPPSELMNSEELRKAYFSIE
ncbi:MAG TPA: ABC transporter ATP-binding protein [Candidatus Dormibacteraeota bacterium]|nr:ABC transporter ATP-binding protein [Candidatus Dormibacteraeota bacterium]